MKLCVFDIETYKRHFVFVSHTYDYDVDTTEHKLLNKTKVKDINGKITSDDVNKINEAFSTCDYIVSFNGSKFDLPVLAKIASDIKKMGQTNVNFVYHDAQELINYDQHGNSLAKVHHYVREWNAKHFDLLNNCLLSKSLKQWEMYLGLPIRELPYKVDADLTDEMKDAIDEYCNYDVTCTAEILWQYGFSKSPRAKIIDGVTLDVNIELLKLWPSHMPYKFDRTIQSISAGINYETSQPLPPTISDPFELFDITKFEVPIEVKAVLKALATGKISKEKDGDIIVNDISYGLGGCHMIKKGLHTNIFVKDVKSMYPSILIILNALKTKAANDKYRSIRDLRLSIKHDATLTNKNMALKKYLNSASGALGIKSGMSTMYDPAVRVGMCFYGQLVITMMANSISRDDLIEVNTDSIFYKGKQNVDVTNKMAELIKDNFGLEFEDEFFEKAYFKDVNNYIIFDKDNNIVSGKGTDWSDYHKKNSETAVMKEFFRHLVLDKLDNKWESYDWKEYIFKYHKSAACKYATIGDEPMQFKNYYFLWTTRDCADAEAVSFSRDLINKKNGSIKTRFGVWSQDIADLEKYKDFIDYKQYQRDFDDLCELWGREDLCTTRLSPVFRKHARTLKVLNQMLYPN